MVAEQNNQALRRTVYLTLVLFAVLLARLWQLQVMMGDEMSRLAAENKLRVVKTPAPRGIIYDRNGVPLVKNAPYYSVAVEPDMAGEADVAAVAGFLGLDAGLVAERMENRRPFEPVILKEGLDFSEVAYIEARLSEYPALEIVTESTRRYIYGEVGSHYIGYLGRPDPAQSRRPELKGVPPKSFIGQWGVEKMYDEHLRGLPGKKFIEVDALGRELRVLSEIPPVRGEDLNLSMDINLQKEAEEGFGQSAGALVALRPETGEVLSLVSKPSFDPNEFARGISMDDWLELTGNRRFPMVNRALQSQYPPGSTFKILTALAALEAGGLDPSVKVNCTGEISHGQWSFGCWKAEGHGYMSLERAMIESCDIFFYFAGKKAGIDAIADYSRRFGLGAESGLSLLREKKGLVPDAEWKRRVKDEPWYLGETYNASIGQGFVLVTPVQLARMISAVANGGRLYRPTMVKAETPPVPERVIEVKAENLELVKRALLGVVEDPVGTAHASMSDIVDFAGKTGTAQVVSRKRKSPGDHAWFVAYAPPEKPEIALVVFVEHGGHGGAAAAPIARRAIETYMKGLGQVQSVDAPRVAPRKGDPPRGEVRRADG